jgi:hypothetical protein
MNDLCYCQYAFTLPNCNVREIGAGVDPHYHVELIREGRVAAIVSRVSLEQFDPERLQGKTAEDIQWLGQIASRHNEVICRAASSSAVLPLRLGTVFQSLDSLRAMLTRCQSTVAKFLEQIGNRQEWGVKLYLEKRRTEPAPGHHGPPSPHYLGPRQAARLSPDDATFPPGEQRTDDNSLPSAMPGTTYLTRKRAQLESRREERADMYQTIQRIERLLAEKADFSCRIRNLSNDLTGRTEEMVFNAAFLLPLSSQTNWLETVQEINRDAQNKGLVLEVSGPWPPYHFCPSLEL